MLQYVTHDCFRWWLHFSFCLNLVDRNKQQLGKRPKYRLIACDCRDFYWCDALRPGRDVTGNRIMATVYLTFLLAATKVTHAHRDTTSPLRTFTNRNFGKACPSLAYITQNPQQHAGRPPGGLDEAVCKEVQHQAFCHHSDGPGLQVRLT